MIFFGGRAHQEGIAERKAMIDRAHDLAVSKQAGVRASAAAASTTGRGRCGDGPCDHAPSRPIASEFPFAGSRMLRGLLAAEGCKIGRRHVKTLMRRTGIEARYRRARTASPSPDTRSTRICCAG